MSSTPLPLFPWHKTVLSSARKSQDSSTTVQYAAIDLFVLGYPTQANKLIDALYEYGHGIEFDEYLARPMLSLYNVWEATGTIPSYISNPDPEKLFNGRENTEESKKTWEILEMKWVEGLPEEWREKARSNALGRKELDTAIGKLNVNPESEEPERSRVLGGEWRDYANPEKSMTLGAVVQVALLVGEEEVARELVKEQIPKLYRHVQDRMQDESLSVANDGEDVRKWLEVRLGLHHSPKIWHLLKSANIGRSFDIKEETLDRFVQKGCMKIKQRFMHGIRRPYADLPISDLVHLIFADLPTTVPPPNNSPNVCFIHLPDEPTTYICPPATPSEIAKLEARIRSNDTEETRPIMLSTDTFPSDYKAFLAISNGFCKDPDAGEDPSAILFPTLGVAHDDVQYLSDFGFTLLPSEIHGMDLPSDISMGEFQAFTIGAGGDEGDIVLCPPSSVKPILEEFEKAYAAASEREKRAYERAAVDVYGGLDKMRKMEWMCTMCFHWAPEQHVWGSFRDWLEFFVAYAVKTRWEDEEEGREKKAQAENKTSDEDGDRKKRKREEGEKEDAGVDDGKDRIEPAHGDVRDERDGHGRDNLRDAKSQRTESL